VYVRACVCAVGALASSSCCRPSIGVHMFVCVCSRALMHQLLSVNGVFLGAARRFPDIPCSMSRDGFTQCPYCDLWVPHVFQMTHLATHGGDMEALLGKPAGSSPAVAGGAAVAPSVDVRLGTPGSVAAAAPFVPTVAASVAGGAVASAPEAPRAETQLVASPRPALSGFGALSGKSLPQTLAWMKERAEAGLLTDLLSATVVRPLRACGCHTSQPPLRPSSRPSQAKKGEKATIACCRCDRPLPIKYLRITPHS
jgi:hypothetical protein